MKMNKNVFYRVYTGVKKGFITATLPNDVLKLQANPIIRVFRFLGGLSVILILTRRLDYLGSGLLFKMALGFCTVLAFSFSIFLCYINYRRFKHMLNHINDGELDVKNSPIDRMASFFAKAIWCSKGFCEGVAPIGVAYGGLYGLDELRKAKGLEPLFIPIIAEMVMPKTPQDNIIFGMRKSESNLATASLEMKSYETENAVVDAFEEKNIITKEEATEWRDNIKKNQAACAADRETSKSAIIKALKELEELRRKRGK